MRCNGWSAAALAFAAAAGAAGCTRGDARPTTAAATTGEGEATRVATARLESAPSGPEIEGTVTFTEDEGGIRVEADVAGLEPGEHGFHVHQVGECAPPGFESAGGHFALDGQQHAGPDDPERHLGDLGNIEVGSDGTAHYTVRTEAITIEGGERSVVGKSVVIHRKRDDYQSQPAGDSGERIACGIIREGR